MTPAQPPLIFLTYFPLFIFYVSTNFINQLLDLRIEKEIKRRVGCDDYKKIIVLNAIAMA